MIDIRHVAATRAPLWTVADRSLSVERVAILQLVDHQLVAVPASVAPGYTKTYDVDCPPEADCFVACVDTQPAGEVRTSRHWNGYLYIHDLVVGAAHRHQGLGTALVGHVQERARALGLPGVMLETQNTNWPACQLYQRCGFRLGGFDALLYKALSPDSDEIALFWYWICARSRH